MRRLRTVRFKRSHWKNSYVQRHFDKKDEAGYRASLTDINEEQLPGGDVTVRVSHSTLNYKDALAITGKGSVVRKFPMVPGIDLVGIVEHSAHPD